MPNSALQLDNVAFQQQDLETGKSLYGQIVDGLMQPQKSIDPKYFYDSYGSELFEQITQLPEYYQTRTERKILRANAEAIANECGRGGVVIEPGSGSSEKVRLLLSEFRPDTYVPIDIASDFLQRSALKLGGEYPWLEVQAICADFGSLDTIEMDAPTERRTIFYPGSTLGNMEPTQAKAFLQVLRRWIDESGRILIGIDLHKSVDRLNAAYNDKEGVTALFNLNALNHINHLTGADFCVDNFSHKAFYNQQLQRIEMHLVSNEHQQVHIGGTCIELSHGETIHTENSYKYTPERFQRLATAAQLKVTGCWTDEENLFAVYSLGIH